jgi:hypothetical protein
MTEPSPIMLELMIPELASPVVESKEVFVTGSLLVQTCESWGNEIILDAGDMTFGGRWYHAAYWQLEKEESYANESNG